jgi:hypothetical protein
MERRSYIHSFLTSVLEASVQLRIPLYRNLLLSEQEIGYAPRQVGAIWTAEHFLSTDKTEGFLPRTSRRLDTKL